MFTNTGSKLKVAAKAVLVIGIILSLFLGIVFIVLGGGLNASLRGLTSGYSDLFGGALEGALRVPSYGTPLIFLGIFTILFGVVISYVVALLVQGYGQIVENTSILAGKPEGEAPFVPAPVNQVWQNAKSTATGVVHGVKQGVAQAKAEQHHASQQTPAQPQNQRPQQPQPAQKQPQQVKPASYQPQPESLPEEPKAPSEPQLSAAAAAPVATQVFEETMAPKQPQAPEEAAHPASAEPAYLSPEISLPEEEAEAVDREKVKEAMLSEEPGWMDDTIYMPKVEDALADQRSPEAKAAREAQFAEPEEITVKYCGQCGTPNEPDFTFCINCGSKLD